MANCRECGATVVWLKKSNGRWFPPVEPVFLGQEYVTANGEGVVQSLPQIYQRHCCDQEQMLEREREKRKLIEQDRARRQAERARTEEEQRREKRAKDRAYALRWFPKRFLVVACRHCGAEVDEPCRAMPKRNGRRTWFRDYLQTPHPERKEDAPPPERRLTLSGRRGRWGEDYEGPWPPPGESPGHYQMRSWLADNFTIFDSQGFRERDWLMPVETAKLTQWLRTNAQLLIDGDGNGTGGVAQGSRGAGGEGVRRRDDRRS